MRELNQQLIKLYDDKNFKEEDFYISKSNKHIYNLFSK